MATEVPITRDDNWFTRLAKRIWNSTLLKEATLFIATSLAVVVVVQLTQFQELLEDNQITFGELIDWANAAGSALGITLLRQIAAWVLSRLAKTTLGRAT